jgi:hypothetical protein
LHRSTHSANKIFEPVFNAEAWLSSYQKWNQRGILSNRKTTPLACRESEISEQTYYRQRKEYGWSKLEQTGTAEGVGEGEREA